MTVMVRAEENAEKHVWSCCGAGSVLLLMLSVAIQAIRAIIRETNPRNHITPKRSTSTGIIYHTRIINVIVIEATSEIPEKSLFVSLGLVVCFHLWTSPLHIVLSLKR